jgi:hypothetical protein
MTRSHASARSPLSPDPIPGGTDIHPPPRRQRPAGPYPKTSPKPQQRGHERSNRHTTTPNTAPGDTTTEQLTESGRSERTHAVIRWIQANAFQRLRALQLLDLSQRGSADVPDFAASHLTAVSLRTYTSLEKSDLRGLLTELPQWFGECFPSMRWLFLGFQRLWALPDQLPPRLEASISHTIAFRPFHVPSRVTSTYASSICARTASQMCLRRSRTWRLLPIST